MVATPRTLHVPAPRRRALPWPRTLGARLLLALTLGLAVASMGYLAVSYRVADGVTRVNRSALEHPPTYVTDIYEAVTFRSLDGLRLEGWWFPAAGDRAVVLVHGKDANRISSSWDPARISRSFIARGYSVLVFDLRGHGESEGLRWALGLHEPKDILAAVDLAAQKAGIDRTRVAVIGESMGAGSALMTVAADPGIGPVVTDSAYADAEVIIGEIAPAFTGLPTWFNPGILFVAKAFFDLDASLIKPIDVVRAHPERAFLFIHCANDTTVYPHHAEDLRAASAHAASDLWIADGCGHVRAFQTHPDEWESRVFAFLDAQMR
ncbi:MAG: alpha/beta hydrolase [Candidatus Limnocylindria bacterium]